MAMMDTPLQLFFEEASEHLAVLEEGLLRMEKSPSETQKVIDELFRSAHTIKGSAALMKLKTIAAVAHRLEDTLDTLREGKTIPAPALVDGMLFALDQIRDLTRIAADGGKEPPDVVEKVERMLDGSESPETSEPPQPQPKQPPKQQLQPKVVPEASPAPVQSEQKSPPPAPPSPDSEPESLPVQAPEAKAKSAQKIVEDGAGPESRSYAGEERRATDRRGDDIGSGVIKVGAEKLEAMMNVLGEITVTKTHLVNQLGTIERMKEEIEFAGHRLLHEVGNFAERYAYALPEKVTQMDRLLSEFQELEFDRYDEMNLFSRKLQEITNDIGEALRSMSGFFSEFTAEVETMDRMIVDMKERISEARTISAGNLFQRFTRTIRELSKQTGKDLRLHVSGAETPLDRVVFDGLYDPLLHIIRNCVSHGFESEQDRINSGKPAYGTIWLSARRRGNTVEIEVRDDGRGMQFEKIHRRGVERGFLQPGQAVSENELLQLIFKPGFSTTESADSTSGRGVGMNVVMERLASLNGTISIATEKGAGTAMRLNLPLSLVIINVIQFRIGNQAFVIPSTLVTEITDLPAAEVNPEFLELRGEKIPTIDLNALFQVPREKPMSSYAIVTQASGLPLALLVEQIVSQEDTVIKPFGSFLGEMPFFSGTSIAGDGALRLVINPSTLKSAEESGQAVRLETLAPAASAGPVVLVVDDSLSVRKYATMLLEANGVETLTASNGFEALEVMEKSHVDFIITDLEMPVMHGYELLGELKRRGTLSHLPVAVLSSRAGEQHQKKAYEMGACAYLIKPFEEESLMEVVRRFTVRAPAGDIQDPASVD